MPFKRRSSRILTRETKSTEKSEYMENTNSFETESDKHEPSKATPQTPQSSYPQKISGKTNFHIENFDFVWKTYEKLKKHNAS